LTIFGFNCFDLLQHFNKTAAARIEGVDISESFWCGGKRSATPLSCARGFPFCIRGLARAKAPSPLRSAGAVQNVFHHARLTTFLRLLFQLKYSSEAEFIFRVVTKRENQCNLQRCCSD